MKKITLFVFFISLVLFVSAQKKASDSQMAMQYYRNKEYAKAAIYFEKIFNKGKSKVYFTYYLRCLIEMDEHKKAEKIIKKQLRKKPVDISYYVDLGYVYKTLGEIEKAKKNFELAIEKMQPQRNAVNKLANAFYGKRELEYAEKTYLKGRKILNGSYLFNLELANVYTSQHQNQKMIDEFLSYLYQKQSGLKTVENRLQYYIRGNDGEDLRNKLRISLLKKIQEHPGQVVYNELLVWLFIQEKNFRSAFSQLRALDRRERHFESQILNLGKLARTNNDFDISEKAFRYLVEKGAENIFYYSGRSELLNTLYLKVTAGLVKTDAEISNVEQQFINVIAELGRNKKTVVLIKQLAHLQAFYLNKAEAAIQLLESALKLRLSREMQAECRIKLADIMLLTGDVWEASLLYAQVEKSNKNNPNGHQAKFKKAQLAYYIGNFAWAKAQLDVLKASTSKLISNNAFELSLKIEDNMAMDSTETALKIFARAELLIHQNKQSRALQAFDSISTLFPTNSLLDDILYKKAQIMRKQGKEDKAIEYLKKIIDTYGYDLLGDDALFTMAEIYEINKHDEDKAMQLYKNVLIEYPSSIYMVEARKRFRRLRGD